MSRNPSFTQAQVRRAVKAAESAGLRVTGVIIRPDGSITVESSGNIPLDNQKTTLASWEDAATFYMTLRKR
jgi:hypothetical protein